MPRRSRNADLGGMKEINLANGKGVAVVDDEDYDKVKDHKWQLRLKAHTNYAQTAIRINGRQTIIKMHRLLTGAAPGQQVDHKDHDGLNNRRDNIRICSSRANQGNRKCINKCGYKGIKFDARGNRKPWEATISITKGIRKSLGCYRSAEDAAEAYDWAALSVFGEFAWTNFPIEYYL